MTASDLLPIVKNYLNITWDDTATDEKILGHIQRGMTYVSSWAAGRELEFKEGSKEVELLLEYCLYVHNYSLATFFEEYLPELSSFQMEQEVKNGEVSPP